MHTHTLENWTHDHTFLGTKHGEHERRTWLVVALTGVMMVGEIIGGTIYGSMALVADGWHMSTHAGALAIAALAYRYARKHAQDARFSFGTGNWASSPATRVPVPAREIHLALAWRVKYHIRGLFVPGVPRGSPGRESFLPQPYTVFVVRDGGRIQPFAEHDYY